MITRTLILFCFFFINNLYSQDLYDLEKITQIKLTFPENNWEYSLHYLFSRGKERRHRGELLLNNEYFDKVGVRFKGFSSYKKDFKKNPLNIKLNYYNKKLKYEGRKTLKLTNGNLDPSWVREVLAYQIARKYMVAPQANFAQVYVNDKYYGLFGNIESVNGKFCKRNFNADKDNVLIKGDSPLGPFAGKKGSLKYFGEDTTAYYSNYELKSDDGWKALKNLTKTIKKDPQNIQNVLNIDGAIWMLAFNNVLVNLDSYSDFQQNYYLFQKDNGQFEFILWDLNLAFGGLGNPENTKSQAEYNPLAKQKDSQYPIINFILNHPVYRKMYFAHCRTILEENFENGWYKEQAIILQNLINEAVKQDTNWVFTVDDFKRNLNETVIDGSNNSFSYPGITELMEARVKFLKNHPAYKKVPPKIIEGEALSMANSAFKKVVRVAASNVKNIYVNYRVNESSRFSQILLFDDGKHNDDDANDGIFGNIIAVNGEELQYYFYAENEEAGTFYPKRAAFEFLKLSNNKTESQLRNTASK